MLGFLKKKEEDTSEPMVELMHKLLNIVYDHSAKQEARIDMLLKLMKPDTTIKLHGMNELKREFQQMIQFEKKRIRDQVTAEKETALLNKLGE